MISATELSRLVQAHFAERANHWKLHPESIRAMYVPSPGGFGTMNFTVQDSQRSYHVKLKNSSGALAAWINAAARLAEKYRAPRLLDKIEIGGQYGVVLERLPGSSPGPLAHSVLRQVVPLLNDMHHDSELADRIGGIARPARETFVHYHLHMLDADLDEIESAVPLPFIDREAVQWMRDETAALRERAQLSASFDEPVACPIHGDLWFGNVLVDGDRWWIIDWDDLKLGDPAHDLSLILFTAIDATSPAAAWLGERGTAFMERFAISARAALLTFVVDPIGDWIEAESFPEVRDSSRMHREGLHRWAFARYRNIYMR